MDFDFPVDVVIRVGAGRMALALTVPDPGRWLLAVGEGRLLVGCDLAGADGPLLWFAAVEEFQDAVPPLSPAIEPLGQTTASSALRLLHPALCLQATLDVFVVSESAQSFGHLIGSVVLAPGSPEAAAVDALPEPDGGWPGPLGEHF